jgi:hypothetical protein
MGAFRGRHHLAAVDGREVRFNRFLRTVASSFNEAAPGRIDDALAARLFFDTGGRHATARLACVH